MCTVLDSDYSQETFCGSIIPPLPNASKLEVVHHSRNEDRVGLDEDSGRHGLQGARTVAFITVTQVRLTLHPLLLSFFRCRARHHACFLIGATGQGAEQRIQPVGRGHGQPASHDRDRPSLWARISTPSIVWRGQDS